MKENIVFTIIRAIVFGFINHIIKGFFGISLKISVDLIPRITSSFHNVTGIHIHRHVVKSVKWEWANNLSLVGFFSFCFFVVMDINLYLLFYSFQW